MFGFVFSVLGLVPRGPVNIPAVLFHAKATITALDITNHRQKHVP